MNYHYHYQPFVFVIVFPLFIRIRVSVFTTLKRATTQQNNRTNREAVRKEKREMRNGVTKKGKISEHSLATRARIATPFFMHTALRYRAIKFAPHILYKSISPCIDVRQRHSNHF